MFPKILQWRYPIENDGFEHYNLRDYRMSPHRATQYQEFAKLVFCLVTLIFCTNDNFIFNVIASGPIDNPAAQLSIIRIRYHCSRLLDINIY